MNKICPKCNRPIIGYSSISRIDNKTEICTNCGLQESIDDFIHFLQNPTRWVSEKYE